MSIGNAIERLWKLQTAVNKMVADGVRDPEGVCNYLQKIVDNPDFASLLAESRTPVQFDWRAEWQKFYQEVFGIAVDLSAVAIPDEKLGFGWVVMVADGLVLNQVWAKCKEKFPSYFYLGDDLDKAVPVNDRTTETAYAKRFRDRVEADEELKDFSADQLKKRHVQSITLLERLLLELWYFWKTGGQHLDIQNITLCAGSRSSSGGVPRVCWGRDRLGVGCYGPDGRHGDLRARAAV